MHNWRFRTGLFGKLILQHRLLVDGAYQEWVDAKAEDLLLWIADIQKGN